MGSNIVQNILTTQRLKPIILFVIRGAEGRPWVPRQFDREWLRGASLVSSGAFTATTTYLQDSAAGVLAKSYDANWWKSVMLPVQSRVEGTPVYGRNSTYARSALRIFRTLAGDDAWGVGGEDP